MGACCEPYMVDQDLRVVPWDVVFKYIKHMNEVHNVGLTYPKKEGVGFVRWQLHDLPNRGK